MSTRQSIGGRSSFMLYLMLILILALAVALAVIFLVIVPDRQQQRETKVQYTQSTATAEARASEVQRAYAAGVAFASAGDWGKAADEFSKVVSLDATYKDAVARLAEVKGKLADREATTTAVAATQISQARAEAQTTALAVSTATAQALDARYRRALGLVNLKQWTEAQAELRAVFDADPNYQDVQAQLAMVNAEVARLTPTAIPTSSRTPVPTATFTPSASPTPNRTPTPPEAQAREKESAQYDWVQRNPPSAPSNRGNYQLAYDGKRSVMVLFGGMSQNGANLGDTWEWDGRRWAETHLPAAPSPRDGAVMVYDSRRGKMILFGGWDRARGPLGDTWEYDGISWREVEVSNSPSPRVYACATYDEERGVLLLFAGHDTKGRFYNDTWTYDGDSWTEQRPTRFPSARSGCAMAYDSGRRIAVLFGGGTKGSVSNLADTWEWDGKDWAERTPAEQPPARGGHVAVYHNRLGVVLLFGGDRGACTVLYEDTWSWDGTLWRKLPVSSPGTHSVIASAYDPVRNSVLLFGGWAGGNSICRVTSDAWEFIAVAR